MTTPANLAFSDIQTRAANALKIPVTNTAEMTKLAAVINETYRDLYATRDWPFLLKRAVINTVARIDAGTVQVAQGSPNIIFSTVPQRNSQNVSVAGNVLLIPGAAQDSNAVYRILSHTGGLTTATLDADYTDITNTAAGYRLYQDGYSLPADTGKVLNVRRFGFREPMQRMGIEEIGFLKETDQSENKPLAYAVYDYATTGDPTSAKLLQVYPYPDQMYRLEIYYKQQLNTELSGTTQPFIPDEFRQLIFYGTLALGFVQFQKDPESAKFYQDKYNNTLALVTSTITEYASDHPGIRPVNAYRRRSTRRRGGISLGRYFDTLPNEP